MIGDSLFGRLFGSAFKRARADETSSSGNNGNKNRTVLLAWELGRGMGHIYRLVPIARELVAQGCRVVFALREQTDATVIPTVLPDAEILPAPCHIRLASEGERGRRSACNYADMLYVCGYDSRESLEPLVAQWQGLFDTVKPDLIVADHSPTVVMAAAGLIPVIHVGSAFANPPAGVPFVMLYPPAADGLEERERRVLASISELRALHGQPPPPQISDLMNWAESFACSLPELDPYRAARAMPALGTIHPLPAPKESSERDFVFGYLAGDDVRVPQVLASLVRAKVKCSLYIRQAPKTWEEKLEGTTVKLFDSPQQLNEVIGAASAVLHHGGATTTEIALALGRPQFLLPCYVEQGLTAEAIDKMGCGLNLVRRKDDVGESIRRALQRRNHVAAAAAQAARIAERPRQDVKGLIVAACLKHLK